LILLTEFLDNVRERCKGKNYFVRLPVLVLFAYILFRYMKDPLYCSVFSGVTLGVHELGHFIFNLFGMFMGVAGGTIAQLAAPIIVGIGFYRQGDFFAVTFALGWLSTSLFDAARYIADARELVLPLVSPFGNEDIVHDWNYMLNELGILQYDTRIASIVTGIAIITMMVALISGSWLLWQMVRQPAKN